ncbi:hypothetical protein ATE75_01955 [Sphingopyxis sp. H080]|nr:hypothetical protein ATE75_01955 [Sphingopyxis sp. H080]
MDDVDDMIAEALLRLLERADFAKIHHPCAYFIRTALRLAYDWSRRAAIVAIEPVGEIDVLDKFACGHVALESALEARDLWARGDRALARLPVRARLCFYHHYIEGHSQDECAALLGVSRSLVEKHLHRARCCLVDVYSSLPDEAGWSGLAFAGGKRGGDAGDPCAGSRSRKGERGEARIVLGIRPLRGTGPAGRLATAHRGDGAELGTIL